MPIFGERDRAQLGQLHSTTCVINSTYDRTASIKMSNSKWKNEKPTLISTPLNKLFRLVSYLLVLGTTYMTTRIQSGMKHSL
ncbi:hypothetical protein L218DRAFT_369255 [Marasmius fiardii PR-910]|nr:hypothetical protein L218DRAFT_369255 [Marasmius fiardii PR-910]